MRLIIYACLFLTIAALYSYLFAIDSLNIESLDTLSRQDSSTHFIDKLQSMSSQDSIIDTTEGSGGDSFLNKNTGGLTSDTVLDSNNTILKNLSSDMPAVVIEGILIDKETGDRPRDDSILIMIDSSKVRIDSSGEFSFTATPKLYYLITVSSSKYKPILQTMTVTDGKSNYFLTLQLEQRNDTSQAIIAQPVDTSDIPWTISGTVVDSRFDLIIESDSTVLLFDADTIKVTKNANFSITTNISGVHTIHVTIPGYQTVTQSITLLEKEKQHYITIPTTILGKTIERREITVSAKRLPVHRSAQIATVEISRKELQRTAATLNDPIRVLQTLPGVASESDISTRPVVRGGDVHEARVFLDGVPLLQPYHYGGVRSTFNQQSLNRLTLYKTGFPAEMHNAQSALIEASSRIPSDEKVSFEFDLNFLQYSTYISFPLFNRKAGLNFSSQGSFYEQILKLIMKIGESSGNEEMKQRAKLINIPDYKDFSAGLSISPSPTMKIFINEVYNTDKTKFTSGDSAVTITYNYFDYDSLYNRVLDTSVTLTRLYSSLDRIYDQYDQPIVGKSHDGNPVFSKPFFNVDTIIDYTSKFNILYSKIQYIPSEKSIFNTTIAWQKRLWDLSFPAKDNKEFNMFDTTVYDINLNQFNLNTGWVYSGIDKHLLKTGVQLDYTNVKYDVYMVRFLHKLISSGSSNFSDFWGALNGDTAQIINSNDNDISSTLMSRILVAYKGKKNFANVAFYCSDGWDISNRLHCDIGTRVEYSQADHFTSLSPRLTVKYNASEKNELMGSIGHYTQNNYDIGIIALSDTLKPEKVWHVALGLESKLQPWLTQKIDVYGKYYYDLASEIIDIKNMSPMEMVEAYLRDIYRYDPNHLGTLSESEYSKLLQDMIIQLNRYSSHYTNEGKGKSYGFEYMLRFDPTDFWHGWFSLSWGQSVRQRREGWKKHPFPLDRPLLISINNYYRLPRKYEIALKYRYMSGLPYTSVKNVNNEMHIGDFNDSRYAPYHRLDIRFSKGFSIRSAKGNMYTEIWSAMNSPNAYGIDSKTKDLITIFPNIPMTMLFVGVECIF